MAMKMQSSRSIVTSAAVLLPLIILLVALFSCVLPSSASRVVTPRQLENLNDAPTNVRNHQNLTSQWRRKRGVADVVMIPQTSNNNNTASVQEWCSGFCNDRACDNAYPWLCNGQDRSHCKPTCDCVTYTCYCFCTE